MYAPAAKPPDAAAFALGRSLFYDARLSRDGSVSCGSCHQQFVAFANADHRLSHGVGGRLGTRNAPTLRNVALTAPYMHDGRFATLEAVLDHYNEHVVINSPNVDPLLLNGSNDPRGPGYRLGLTTLEKAKIVAFLRTLTYSTFIRDPRFARS